jgi:hypothetical protein
VKIEETGTPILFIDAIDRIEKEQQPVILDIIRTINQSAELKSWRIIASLRDTGIDALQHWLGDVIDGMSIETLPLANLNDEEAEELAVGNPSLRSLLFGSAQLEGIVRRPFFAKVLHQNYTMDPQVTFQPRSEVELITNWWRLGGYNETGQHAVERQRLLLNLAQIRARTLNKPIKLSQLNAVTHIEALKSDGLLQSVRDGISVRFTHDIFFEWAYFYVLADHEDQWIAEIQTCGEPPALARVVELTSQWEYSKGENWHTYLESSQVSGVRTQWLRAWLLGPLGLPDLLTQDDEYTKTVFADNFLLFKKALVWFQAEKITPNQSIATLVISSALQQRYAYLASWPSDCILWRRFIDLILTHISHVPQRLYPDILPVFEIWQNVFFGTPNPVSRAVLLQCEQWLNAIDKINYREWRSYNASYWREVPELESFRKSLRQLILRSSMAEPAMVSNYLQQASQSSNLRKDVFHNVLAISHLLTQSHSDDIVVLSLACFKQELPANQLARETAEKQRSKQRLKAIQAKPKSERTPHEQAQLENASLFLTLGNTYHDWEQLCLDDGLQYFWPPSPLREPFHSLFQHSPNNALRLVQELCNHASTAWRQMHVYSNESTGTPVPLELTFPWGNQQFWGNDRTYQWFRATSAPHVLGCALMALEAWCFAELKRGRPVDALLQQIVTGNESIAILGVAVMLTLHTETVSHTTLPLLTSQRVLSADHQRMCQDMVSATTGLTSFNTETDKQHIEAIHTADARAVRQKELKGLILPHFISGGEYSELLQSRILGFTDSLPFQYEEHRNMPQYRTKLLAEAKEYAELVEQSNYQFRSDENKPGLMIISHTSPSSAAPKHIARVKDAKKFLNFASLLAWASKSLEAKVIQDTFTLSEAIAAGKEIDAHDVLAQYAVGEKETQLTIYRGALSATAAVVLMFREEIASEELDWARDVLMRALNRKEKVDRFWTPDTISFDHPLIFVGKGLTTEFHAETLQHDTVRNLLVLMTHPLKAVSLAATRESCTLWKVEPKMVWASLVLVFSRSCTSPRSLCNYREQSYIDLPPPDAETVIESLLKFTEGDGEWPHLPVPPSPWVKRLSSDDEGDSSSDADKWDVPDIIWNAKDAGKILSLVPIESILVSERKDELLSFLQHTLSWTIQKYAKLGNQSGRDTHSLSEISEWSLELGTILGQLAGLMPFSSFKTHFLEPIIKLEDNHCLELLYPLVDIYICRFVYDAQTVPSEAVALLEACLNRLLECPEFEQNTLLCKSLSGFQQPRLVNTLMFISVKQAGGSARYANGDWSELSLILPIIDRFVRAAGWEPSVMSSYLTLCERAKMTYPAGMFAEQILSVLSQGADKLRGWQGTLLPDRIAELVQHFAHRDTPMTVDLAQKLLRVLDILVDIGDRRSASLQLSESFREIRRAL